MVDILSKCALLWWISPRGKCAISEVNVEYQKLMCNIRSRKPKLKK
jgi:hypothetical protein